MDLESIPITVVKGEERIQTTISELEDEKYYAVYYAGRHCPGFWQEYYDVSVIQLGGIIEEHIYAITFDSPQEPVRVNPIKNRQGGHS